MEQTVARCPYCGSVDTRVSRKRTAREVVISTAGFSALRCRECRRRFLYSAWLGGPNPARFPPRRDQRWQHWWRRTWRWRQRHGATLLRGLWVGGFLLAGVLILLAILMRESWSASSP